MENKIERKEKHEFYSMSYPQKLDNLTKKNVKVLDDVAIFFQKTKREWYNYKDQSPTGRTNFVQSYTFKDDEGKTQQAFTYRFFQGIRQEIKGMLSSIDTNRDNYIFNNETKRKTHLKSHKSKIKTNNANKHNLTNKTPSELKEDNDSLAWSFRKLAKIDKKIAKLKKDKKEKNYSISFGGKNILRKRAKLISNKKIKQLRKEKRTTIELNAYLEWKKEFFDKRHNAFLLVGSYDEIQGCSNGQLYYDERKNTFDFKLTIPPILRKIHGNTILIKNIKISNNGLKEIKNEILKHQSKDENDILNRNAMSYRFIKRDGQYNLNVTINREKKTIKTTNFDGVIGLDINPDNLAVSEINSKGDLLTSFVIPMKFKNKTSEQSKNIIGIAVKDLMDFVESKNKDLIIEKLDFKKKKAELQKKYTPKYSAMLSSFAYSAITNNIERQGFKRGIEVEKVNPAYTSFLGKVNFQVKKGLSIHQAAAFVIARRSFKFKEKVNKEVHIMKGNKVYTLCVKINRLELAPISSWIGREVKDGFSDFAKPYRVDRFNMVSGDLRSP